jgi:Rps23 Pro-64 3,4-dihydroxylase Tpa1-like proline 4-hydroxylase
MLENIQVYDGKLEDHALHKAIIAAETSHSYYPFHQAGDGSGFKYSWQIYFPEANIKEFASPEIKALWWDVQKFLPDGSTLRKCYINAHQYGVEDTIHQDDTWINKGKTVIVYLTRGWFPDWGGSTMFFSGQDRSSPASSMDIEKCVLPKYNRFVIFDKDIYHCAGLVSRKFIGLRLTCMFKVEIPE